MVCVQYTTPRQYFIIAIRPFLSVTLVEKLNLPNNTATCDIISSWSLFAQYWSHYLLCKRGNLNFLTTNGDFLQYTKIAV